MNKEKVILATLFCMIMSMSAFSAPPIPTLKAPSSGSTGLPTTDSLKWYTSTGATSYGLQVSVSSTFNSFFLNITGITTTFYLVTGLARGTQYYWRVNAKNSGGTSSWSPAWNFSTIVAAPSPPTLLSPVNGQTGMAITPRFSWNNASRAFLYQIQISTNSGFNPVLRDSSPVFDTFYNATKSLNFSTYYWRVRAQGVGGISDWSSQWTFTTEMLRQILIGDTVAWGDPLHPNTLRELSYVHKLGYNYVLVYVQGIMNWMTKPAGHWVFNGGNNYTDATKSVVANFKAFKKAIEDSGMHALPAIIDLSHSEGWITDSNSNWHTRDGNALSEFSSNASYQAFVVSNHLIQDIPTLKRNAVYCANDTNTAARDIFVEQLKIIQSNWGNTTIDGLYPQYIHINHDEIGNWDTTTGQFVCYVGAEKTDSLCNARGGVQNGVAIGKAWVIANQIRTKKLEIDTFCNPGVKMIVWGDCFAPMYNGQSGGLIGDQNGNGSILQFLRDTMKLTNNLIIEPWDYGFINGDQRYQGYPINQITIVQFIQKFGFGCVLVSGEGGMYITPSHLYSLGMENVHRHLQIAYEQVRASQFYPNNFIGLGENQYNSWTTDGFNDTLAGYTSSILAYFGWAYGQKSLFTALHQGFSPQVYANFNPIQSRKNYTWLLNSDYFRPSNDRILPVITEQAAQ